MKKEWWTLRDWKWLVFILIGVIVIILTYKFWGKNEPLTQLISLGGGIASLALAFIAIIISLTESVKSSNMLTHITDNIKSSERLINQLSKDNAKTQDIVKDMAINYEEQLASQESLPTESWKKEDQEDTQESNDYNKKNNGTNSSIEESQEIPKVSGQITKGDVYFADLSPVVGSEQGGVRPVLIISNDINNRFSLTVSIAPITAQINKAKLPTHVELDALRYGFERDSVILLEQIKTIDKQRISDKITHLDSVLLTKVDEAIQIQLGLIDF